jgi:hypothetical protein
VDAFSWLPLEKTPIGKVERILPVRHHCWV